MKTRKKILITIMMLLCPSRSLYAPSLKLANGLYKVHDAKKIASSYKKCLKKCMKKWMKKWTKKPTSESA
jgi:hypothetical protein